MVNHSSIKYISSLLNNPDTITTGDQSSIALFRQTFPYFVPVRYLAAMESNKHSAFSAPMLSEIQPYLGDWILFCDFLHAGNRERKLESIERVVDKKKVEVSHADIPVKQEQSAVANKVVPPIVEQVIKEQPVVTIAPQVVEQAMGPKQDVEADKVAQPVIEQPQPVGIVPNKVVVEEDEIVTIHKEEEKVPEPDVIDEVVEEQKEENEIPVQEEEQPVRSIYNEIIAEQQKENDIPVQEEETVPVIQDEPETEEVTEIVIDENEHDAEEIAEVVVDSKSFADDIADEQEENPLILPVYTQDYFLQQGEKISEEIPEEIDELVEKEDISEEDKSLMVVMSFSEWLLHFKNTSQKQQEEKKDQKALKTMWQKEKLAAAMEEENEEIPENVFEMAVNSITKEDGLASETLAEIYIKQEKYDQAIEMYRKLSLRNPQKSTYFARKIEEVLKEK